MKKQDWKELGFWIGFTGAFLTLILLCYSTSWLIVEIVKMAIE